MFTLSMTRLAAATGGLALSLTAAAGVAAASPDLGGAVNTTCSYPQVVAALNAQSPTAAAEFNSTPMAQSFLQNFLASPPPQRQQMLEQAQGIPEAAGLVSLVQPLASSCSKF